MRILANENFPRDAVEALRQEGHDVVWIREDAPGSSDHTIIERAQRESLLLLTFDKDFGELAFRLKLPVSSGIILFRITPKNAEYIAKISTQVLASRSDWVGNFSVIEDHRIRMRRLPE